jgi:hypothetical protein
MNLVGKKIGVWLMALALLGSQLFFRSEANAESPQIIWREMQARSGDCKISFPGMPQLIEQSLKVEGSDARLTYDVYLAPLQNRGVCLLLIAQYPSEVPAGQEMMGLQALVKGILTKDSENKLVFSEPALLQKFPALNFMVQNGKNYFRAQAIMAGNKLYMIAMEGGKSHFDESLFQIFLKSFQLLIQ